MDFSAKGPSAYALQGDLESVQAPFIGERLYVDNDPRYPAPNAYCIPETVGTGLKKSFGIKQTYDAASSEYTIVRGLKVGLRC